MRMANDEINDMLDQPDALDQSVALNRIALQLLEERSKDFRRIRILLLISIVVNLLVVAIFMLRQESLEESYKYLLDGIELEDTITTTTEVIQDADGSGNNILQVGDKGKIVYGESGGDLDGTTNSEDHKDNNQN